MGRESKRQLWPLLVLGQDAAGRGLVSAGVSDPLRHLGSFGRPAPASGQGDPSVTRPLSGRSGYLARARARALEQDTGRGAGGFYQFIPTGFDVPQEAKEIQPNITKSDVFRSRALSYN